MAIETKFPLPSSFGHEAQRFRELSESGSRRTSSGNTTFISETSSITYNTSSYSGGIYANTGQNGLYNILADTLSDYLIDGNWIDSVEDTVNAVDIKVDNLTASDIPVVDAGDYFDVKNLEAATQKLAEDLTNLSSDFNNLYVVGTYTGNNASNRAIALGFQPSIVIVESKDGTRETINSDAKGGMALVGFPVFATITHLQITDTGFLVSGGFNYSTARLNPYRYIAIR